MPSGILRFLSAQTILLLATVTGIARAAEDAKPALALSSQQAAALTQLKHGDAPLTLLFDSSKRSPAIRFHAIPLQAGEQLLADDPEGRLAKRHFLISDRGRRQVALAFEADGEFAFGFLDDEYGLQKLVARNDGKGGLTFVAQAVEEVPVNCEADEIASPPTRPLQFDVKSTASSIVKGGVAGYQAKVAIEVDYPMMNGHFGNSPAAAMNWLQELFLATNLYYQRDLALQLVMANPVIVNTSPDPYCTGANPCSPLGPYLLFQFSANWRNNHTAIDRDFAALISGRLGGGNPTGLSWNGQFCEDGHDNNTPPFGTQTAGSYSANLYVAGMGVSGGTAAELFGHELGHQLGAVHNNCTDTDPSASFQPIDHCSNNPASTGAQCWTGSLSCPTSGAGLMMSTGCSDLTGCALNRQREFHPVQINLLTNNIASNTPSCLSTATLPDPDTLFFDGFE